MFWLIMIAVAAIVAIGWIAYGIWEYRLRLEEKRNPRRRPTTEHLDEVKRSFDDYTKKIEKFELKPYEREEKK